MTPLAGRDALVSMKGRIVTRSHSERVRRRRNPVRTTAARYIAAPAVGILAAAALIAGGAPASAATTSIHDIQGAAHVSPMNGDDVSGVAGVVTAVDDTGFWMQDTDPDSSAATSEGIYVYTGSAPSAAVGDAVRVAGTVDEYRPGGASTSLSTTEIEDASVSVSSHDNTLPAPVLVGPNGRKPPTKAVASPGGDDVETHTTFDPATYGLDFWESLEGMRVEVKNATAVGPTNSYDETPVLPGDYAGSGTRTTRHGVVMQSDNSNPERLILADAFASVPAANVGDSYPDAVGILDYGFDNYRLEPTTSPDIDRGSIARQKSRAQGKHQVAVATFNVENLAPTDPQSKFDTLGTYVAYNLASPDLISVEEVQDNDGATDDGVVACGTTMKKLVAAIAAAGGPTYKWAEIDPTNDADGGEPGGNIRNVFLYRTDRGLSLVSKSGGSATSSVKVVAGSDGLAHLSESPGRIDPTNAAWDSSRKPLVGEFAFRGKQLIVISNHFDAKLGDQPLMGRYQPPAQSSRTQRNKQAAEVASFVKQVYAVDSDANVIVLGDLNDYDFSPPIHKLTAAGLRDLPAELPLNKRYTYDYQGNSEVLDHILISPDLVDAGYYYRVVHVNSEFHDQISDHEPSLVRLELG